MSNTAVQAVKLATKHGPKVGKLIVDLSPQVFKAGAALIDFLEKHPELPAQVQARIAELAKRVENVKKDRGEAAQIRGKLDIVRSEARELHAEDADFLAGDVEAWIARANGIEHAIRLAERQSKSEQTQTFARLRGDADELVDEIITAIAAGGTAENSTVGV